MKRTVIAALALLCTMVQGAWAADISNAIVYNPWRFLPYNGDDSYDIYAETIEVYAYDNGWKKLRAPQLISNSPERAFNTENADFVFSIRNSNGERVYEVKQKGVYTLTVEGVNGYEGTVEQTIYITDRGDWTSYKADAFSNIDTDNRIITIENEAEMARLAWNFNRANYEVEYQGWTFRLARDLDLSAHYWTPIGSCQAGDETDFKGHFDGQGHTISGMHFERENRQGQSSYLFPQGLFALISNDRTASSVKNLTLTDSDIASGRNEGAGGIVGMLNAGSEVVNCHATQSVNVVCMHGEDDGAGGTAYGGIVGLSYGRLRDCTSSAHVFKAWDAGTCKAFGGIVGNCNLDMEGGELTNCAYTGDQVMADSQTGAIAGGYTNSRNKTVTAVYFSSTLSGCNGTDPNGITRPTVVTSNLSTMGTSGQTSWYFVNSDVTLSKTLTLHGDVRLVLADGKTMTVNGGNAQAMIGADASLSVYGQEAGTGRLAASSTGSNAIQLYNFFHLYGGNVDAVSAAANGIYAGAINIYGGALNPSAPNEHNAIDASMGNITIIDGRVNASQCSAGYNLNISGGKVNFGQVFASSITLDWTHATDSIYVGEYYADNITIADGKTFLTIGDKAQLVSGTIGDAGIVNNKLLIPAPFSTGDDVVVTADYYYIFTNDGWNMFCDRLEDADGKTFFQGKTVLLCCDVNTARMASSSGHEFSGSFDGGGHTLTVSYDSSEEYTAPFRFIRNANISGLNVEGTISTSQKFAAGIAAHAEGTNTIADCHVNATISSTVEGDGSHGGLAAHLEGGMNTITDCSFTGSMLGENTSCCGGFIGWTDVDEYNKTTLNNSLFRPASMTINDEDCCTFARCYEQRFIYYAYTYYINTFGETQGEIAYATDPNLEDYALRTLADGNDYFVYSPVFWAEEDFRDTSWGNDYDTAATLTINDEADMAQFANLVNLGNDFNGKTVILANDLDMAQHYWLPAATMWQDGMCFRGTFDGDGHTIFNLRANVEPGNIKTQASGLFGGIENATVRNLTLHNLKAKGGIRDDVGGIAGHASGSIVENCHITSADITNSDGYSGRAAAIVAYLQNSTIQGCTADEEVSIYAQQAGGIAAIAYDANILGCVSNATVISLHKFAGGIVSFNDCNSTIADCLFLGDRECVPELGGAIVGETFGTISNTFFTDARFSNPNRYINAEGATCGYPHVTPPTAIGEQTNAFQGGTTAYTNGLSYDNLFYMNSLYLEDNADNASNIAAFEGVESVPVTLYGRTLWKDGTWNTLCLPFDVTLDESPLANATVKKLSSADFNNGTLTLNFGDATSIKAGTPYLVKWTETDSPISNPCFNGVTVTALSPKSTDCGVVTFQGIYSPLSIAEADKTKLYLGSNNTLFYPNGAMSINAFRAFFQLNGITAGDLKQGAKNIVLNFGDDATTFLTLGSQNPSDSDNDAYYDLQGRRVSGSSTLPKGIYIHNGKKIIK